MNDLDAILATLSRPNDDNTLLPHFDTRLVHSLVDEVRQLRAALKPFADFAAIKAKGHASYATGDWDHLPVDVLTGLAKEGELAFRHCRLALALLTQE